MGARTRIHIEDLADELALGAAMRLGTNADAIRDIVDAVVDYLVEEYSAKDLYIPAPASYPVAEIRADIHSMSMRNLCRKYRLDRRTIYRLLDDAG